MAQRVISRDCLIPAGTAIAVPAHFPLQFPSAEVERIDIRIPPGPGGLVGFAIFQGGGNFIPETNGTWIIAEDEAIQWPLSDAPNNGNWDIVCYNLDVLSHTIYVRFNVNNLAVVSIPGGTGLVGL